MQAHATASAAGAALGAAESALAPLMDHANFLTAGAADGGHAAAVLGVAPPVAARAYDPYGAHSQQPPAGGYQYHDQYPTQQYAQPVYQAPPPPPAGRAPQPPAPPPAEEGGARPQRHSGGMWKVVEA